MEPQQLSNQPTEPTESTPVMDQSSIPQIEKAELQENTESSPVIEESNNTAIDEAQVQCPNCLQKVVPSIEHVPQFSSSANVWGILLSPIIYLGKLGGFNILEQKVHQLRVCPSCKVPF